MGSDMVVFFDPAIDCGLGLAGGSTAVVRLVLHRLMSLRRTITTFHGPLLKVGQVLDRASKITILVTQIARLKL